MSKYVPFVVVGRFESVVISIVEGVGGTGGLGSSGAGSSINLGSL